MSEQSGRLRTGLCSVTFRALSAGDVVAHAVAAGLESIEWGGDVHVPAHDLNHARAVGELTRDAGLAVASLGSYFRCTPSEEFDVHLASASALGAPRIRVWAGHACSKDASTAERAETTAILRESALRAEDHGIELALEYHSGTLTDSAESARTLLEDVASDTVTAYWQPAVGASDAEALSALKTIGPWLSAIHVFSWWPRIERLPLRKREPLWSNALAFASTLPRVTDALLEFVPDDDPNVLQREAETLRGWIPSTG